MFQAHTALYLYCVSPVHMGAGTAFGLIDSPIQRERHTGHPSFAGSGLKGAIRHQFAQMPAWKEDGLLDRLFGPEGGDLFAGAVSVGDAQLVAFPVRSTKGGYAYATSAIAISRLARLLQMVGKPWGVGTVSDVPEGQARTSTDGLIDEGKVYLEMLELAAGQDETLKRAADHIADCALPPGDAHQYFRDKLRRDLVLLSERDFAHLTKNATSVEPHVRIDDQSGTASEGGLFYVENLPPESLLAAPLMASSERSGRSSTDAQAVLAHVLNGVGGQLLQVGGDATTGRGLVMVTPAR